MNYSHIAGHLGADPETRFTSAGQKVTTLRVACRSRKDETIWYKVTIWGEQFDRILPYFKKGSPIVVSGELMKPDVFNDREGKPQVSLQINAHHIGFSPFGKPKSSDGGAMGQSSAGNEVPVGTGESLMGESGGFGGFEQTSGGPADSGGSADSGAFSDEEIPF